MVNGKQIMDELKSIKGELKFIKTHMVDVDSIMIKDDYEALEEYKKEKRARKLISHEELKKELKL